jgi:Ca2+-transporting ATPase
MDPPRPEVAAAVKTFRQAGIRLVMITGDYGLTAESLARRVGMVTGPAPRILTGAELDGLNDAELDALLGEEVIFARMAPEHKLRLVAAFQARGEVVAVTGDGVNDAPALRKADVGLAMGITGTDVAKEAADVVLTDDNFAAIASAIEEGRAVYDNLRKFTTYIFASNVPEVLPFLLSALLNLPLALTVTQILAIDLGTDLLPALALGTEPPEKTVMQRPPRRRDAPWLDRGLLARAFLWLGPIEATLCFAGFFGVYVLAGYTDLLHLPRVDWLPFAQRLAMPAGRDYILATTVFHAGVVMAQVGNAFACRTEKARGRQLGWLRNRFLLAGVAAEIVLILLLIYVPPLAERFEHLPLPAAWWAILAVYPFVLYGLDRLRKSLVRRQTEARLAVRGQGVTQ